MSAASRLHDLLFLHSIHRCRVVLDSFVNTLNHVQLVPQQTGRGLDSEAVVSIKGAAYRPTQLRIVALAWAPDFFRGSILVFEHTLPTGEWQFSQHSRIGCVSLSYVMKRDKFVWGGLRDTAVQRTHQKNDSKTSLCEGLRLSLSMSSRLLFQHRFSVCAKGISLTYAVKHDKSI
ncbi:hypothetical protein R3P38DRAFT_2768431 [Favolaschia claudopus]|uniref:Uncharacterized protein n=1 Tax=Favolaschia claudopus TaxID=2862362 RepID=A0AAW0CSN3_9AGAR